LLAADLSSDSGPELPLALVVMVASDIHV
jgi:hypothetical protein